MDKLLVIEDEVITSDLLRRYFEIVGYEVINALNGADGIRMAAEHQPRVIILDIMLPDMDGYEVCRRLRRDERTDKIPIIFLTQKDDRRDRLEGLGLGADDYLTKPFDVEELRLRVHNIIDRQGGTPLVDARTSLPNIALIKERLPRLLEDPASIFLDVQIEHLEAFGRRYGPVAANQAIRTAAKIISDVLHEVDPRKSFIGHPRDDHFLLVTSAEAAPRVEKELPERFSKQVARFYDYPDQQCGRMQMGNETVPFMAFRVVRVSADALRSLVASAEKPEPPPPMPKPASTETVPAPPPSSTTGPVSVAEAAPPAESTGAGKPTGEAGPSPTEPSAGEPSPSTTPPAPPAQPPEK